MIGTLRKQLTLQDIMKVLKPVAENNRDFKIGVAGSFATGRNKRNSDIDIVIDGDSTNIDLEENIRNLFNVETDILWVDLLKKEDKELDEIAVKYDLPINDESVYKTVMKEVQWV